MKRKRKKLVRTDPFAGITRVNCCDGCVVSKCAISRRAYCGHPHKGGLQGAECHDTAAARRLEACGDMIKGQSGALIA